MQLQPQIDESISNQSEVTAAVADDGTVTQSGYVDEDGERYRIVELAKGMAGVTDVENLITSH